MTNLRKGEIVPGERVGAFYLGFSRAEIEQLLPQEKEVEELAHFWLIKTPAMWFWVGKTSGVLVQILVFGDFQGKLLGKVGLGSTLSELRGLIGEVEEQAYEDQYPYMNKYRLPEHPGVIIELEGEGPLHDAGDDEVGRAECIAVYVPAPATTHSEHVYSRDAPFEEARGLNSATLEQTPTT